MAELDQRSAAIRSMLEETYAGADFLDQPTPRYHPGDKVLFLRPPCRQKRFAAYEVGWVVMKHVGSSTILIRHAGRGSEKIVNVKLVKRDPSPAGEQDGGDNGELPDVPSELDDDEPEQDEKQYLIEVVDLPAAAPAAAPVPAPAVAPGRVLRDRSRLQVPARYR